MQSKEINLFPKRAVANPYDLNRVSVFTTVYETGASVAIFAFCDLAAQTMEGREKFDVERTLRGTCVNLICGGGAMYWYWWLYLDVVFPGTTFGTICIKAALDTFIYSTLQNIGFLYIYNATKENSHEAGVKALRENGMQLNYLTWATSFPSDVAAFYVFGWWRELVSDLSTVTWSLLVSYYGSNKRNRAPVPTPAGTGSTMEELDDDPTKPVAVTVGAPPAPTTETDTDTEEKPPGDSTMDGESADKSGPPPGPPPPPPPAEFLFSQHKKDMEKKFAATGAADGAKKSSIKSLRRTACGCFYFWQK